jgi:hypothetical protein
MATIWPETNALARCSVCGVQRQFHFKSDVPHSADRDHAFSAETIADFEPGDLTPAQLVSEIFHQPNSPRAVSCGDELRTRVPALLGVSWDDLSEALS